MTRGQRNNNPLNIVLNPNFIWQGQVKNPKETRFVTFNNLTNGFRAAIMLIRTYINKYGLNTIEQIVSRWAPESENNTEAYINTVCKFSGLKRDEPIAFYNKDRIVRLVDAMAFVENGVFFNKDNISRAYDLVN